MNAQEKREEQKKETWIKNIMRIQEKCREEAEKLYKTIYNIDWRGVSGNIVVDRYKYSEIVEFFLQSEFGRIMNMSTPYQRFNNLFSLRNKFDGWGDMKTMDKINHQMMKDSFLVIEDILNTYSGVEAIKRLSIFNKRTKYRFHRNI